MRRRAAISKTHHARLIDKGCAVLYEEIAEAFDPKWKNLIYRMFVAMLKERERQMRSMLSPTKPPRDL